MENKKLKISKTQSKIEWVGKKVTGSHNGTIDMKEGELMLNDGKIVGGTFIVDTTSIKILDITDPETNAQFAGHLASDDFFSSQQFPEARLEITSVIDNLIEGVLTIKGIMHEISFPVTTKLADGIVRATAKIIVDRTKYEMKFRSGNFFQNLGDTLIYNDFELNVSITAGVAEPEVSMLA